MVNGAPVKVTVVDPSGATPTTIAVTVTLDPSNQLILQPTFATSNALRLAFNYDMTASNKVDLTTSPPTLTVTPFMSAATTAADSKLIRVRGPLINSSVTEGTYTVVVRPFFDEVNSLGIDTMFNDANTIYTYGGQHLCRRTRTHGIVASFGGIDGNGGVLHIRTDDDSRCGRERRHLSFRVCRRRKHLGRLLHRGH